ncbi:MAG: hypothetical protein PHG25_00490 [Candidatus Pacebacteria bacterium]|nr:hypothetical protein [Candidatus Paceibacterota bacterium]
MSGNFDLYHSWRYVAWGFALLITEMVIWELFALRHKRKDKRIKELLLVWDTLITDEGTDDGLKSFLTIMDGVNQYRLSTRLFKSKEYPRGCPDLDACRMVAINALERRAVHLKYVVSVDARNTANAAPQPRIELPSALKYLGNQKTTLQSLAL